MNEPLRTDPPAETVASLRDLLESYTRGVERAEKHLAAETDPAERKLIEQGLRLTREHRDEIAAQLRDAEQEENMATKKKNPKNPKNPKRTAKEPTAPESSESQAPTEPADDKAPPEEPKVEVRRYTDTLRVPLTEPELVVKGEEQARLLRTVADMEARQKSDAKHQKAAIDEKKAEMGRLASEICDRATFKPVECERRFDFTAGIVTEVRTDTGEVIGSRPMLSSERQRNLPIDDEELDESDGDDESESDGDDDESEDDDDDTEDDEEASDAEEEADENGKQMSARARAARRGGRGARKGA